MSYNGGNIISASNGATRNFGNVISRANPFTNFGALRRQQNENIANGNMANANQIGNNFVGQNNRSNNTNNLLNQQNNRQNIQDVEFVEENYQDRETKLVGRSQNQNISNSNTQTQNNWNPRVRQQTDRRRNFENRALTELDNFGRGGINQQNITSNTNTRNSIQNTNRNRQRQNNYVSRVGRQLAIKKQIRNSVLNPADVERPNNFTGDWGLRESDSEFLIKKRFSSLDSVFYRTHKDPNTNSNVRTLTESGLVAYIYSRIVQDPALRNCYLIGDGVNSRFGSGFSPESRNRFREEFSIPIKGRRSYIVHRDGHTVSLMREGDTFLVFDSYNAHGVNDDDLRTLLSSIREANPNAKIAVLNDMIQRDYNNCKIFSMESVAESEKFMQEHNLTLDNFIELSKSDCRKVNTGASERETQEVYDDRERFYQENRIETIPTPIPLVPLIQSNSQIDKTIFGNHYLLDQYNIGNRLRSNRSNNGLNNTVENISRITENYMRNLHDNVVPELRELDTGADSQEAQSEAVNMLAEGLHFNTELRNRLTSMINLNRNFEERAELQASEELESPIIQTIGF